jgi:hypothetical protein
LTSAGLERHCQQVAGEILAARVVPFLGAGANLYDRPGAWAAGSNELPSAPELACHLAHRFSLPNPTNTDLVRVSQLVIATFGELPLYAELHRLFEPHFTPNFLHELLAWLPSQLRASRAEGLAPRDVHQLIVTTNYDDALEAAFRAAKEPFDCLSYIADGADRGRLQHRAPDGSMAIIRDPDAYRALSLEARTVILKIHGAVDRDEPDRDSYVISEDDYIDYLTRTDISLLLPPELVEKLRRSHIHFLGYSLRDWNMRAMFHRIWQERRRGSTSWAVQREANDIDVQFWRDRRVEIRVAELREYVETLSGYLRGPPKDRADAA